MRYRYRICGLTLASEIALPELPLASAQDLEREPDASFRIEEPLRGAGAGAVWFMSLALPSGEPSLACAKEPGCYRLRFPQLADFRVDTSGRWIVCEAGREVSQATIRHLLLDQVIPRALSLLGIEALHATAVLTPHGACAFTGLSGAGKSTLAASFHLAGHPVLSDDCLVLREEDKVILATPAYPGVRLWDDSAVALCPGRVDPLPPAHGSAKRRVLADMRQSSCSAAREALVRIYHLGETLGGDGESGGRNRVIEEVSRRQAFIILVTSGFRLDITDRTLMARQFDFLERIAMLVSVRRLHVPEDFSALPAIRDTILADLRAAHLSRQQAA